MIKAIFASDLAHGFGFEGGLPWPSIKEDFDHFKEATMGNYIVMGYNTYKTLPTLKGRVSVVMSRDDNIVLKHKGDLFVQKALLLEESKWLSTLADVSFIGGTSLLIPEHLEHCDEIYHTTVKGVYEADTYVPKETMAYLSTLNQEILLETEQCIIRKYT